MVECGLPKAETRVRFPSPAPLFSSANSQFSRPLSYECHTKPPGSAPFSEVFSPGIETVVQGPVTFLTGWRLSLIPCRENMVPHALTSGGVKWRRPSCDGGGGRPFSRFLGHTLAVAAKRSVVPPACLGPWTSVVGWPGMRTIWRRASGTARVRKAPQAVGGFASRQAPTPPGELAGMLAWQLGQMFLSILRFLTNRWREVTKNFCSEIP